MSAQVSSICNVEEVAGYAAARLGLGQLIAKVSTPRAQRMPHSAIEEMVKEDGLEILRCVLQGHVDLRGLGAVDGDVVGADGEERTHKRETPRKLVSLFGVVVVARLVFSGRGLGRLAPKDAWLNLPQESYSYGVRRFAAEHAARVSFDETVKELASQTGAPVPKRQVEELVVRAAQDFDDFYRTRKDVGAAEVNRTGPLMVLTADAKGIVVHAADLRPQTRKAAQAEAAASVGNIPPGRELHTVRAENRKRMVSVAATYTIAPHVRTPQDVLGELNQVREVKTDRPRAENKWMFATVRNGPEEALTMTVDEALRRDPHLVKTWLCLLDGNDTQIRVMKELVEVHGLSLTIILDFLHVAHYVWKAVGAFFADKKSPAAAKWVHRHLAEILEGKASLVAAGMRRSATLQGMSAKRRKPVDDCADYLLKYADYLHYDCYLAAGYPIATGVIEGACRYLVKDRMDITGAVWRLNSAEAVLRLRAIRASGDFEDYWQYHLEREHERNHASHYRNGLVPSARAQRPGCHLRLVS